MSSPTLPTSTVAREILGDVRALAAAAHGLTTSTALEPRTRAPAAIIDSAVAWHAVVDGYFAAVLVPWEWPLIAEAHRLAVAGHARELVAADQAWSRAQGTLPVLWRNLGEASFRVGQRQLSRLRPLRDQRIVQRYLAAIERGEARGWHPLVYGLVLATFALPLRQGLQQYARQTAAGFLLGTPFAETLDEPAQALLLDEVERSLIPTLHRLLPVGPVVTGQSVFLPGR